MFPGCFVKRSPIPHSEILEETNEIIRFTFARECFVLNIEKAYEAIRFLRSHSITDGPRTRMTHAEISIFIQRYIHIELRA